MTILSAAQEAASMGRRKKANKRSGAKTILRLPDLEQSKNAVLNSLAAASSQESYAHAIDEFIGWYECASPYQLGRRSPSDPRGPEIFQCEPYQFGASQAASNDSAGSDVGEARR
jgi:hypothetical protein